MKKIKYIIFTIMITLFNINVFAANAPFMVTDYKSCGDGLINKVPSIVISIANSLYNTLMILVPLILIFLGVLDLVRGMMSQKEDEIRKGKDGFIKRTVMGLFIFLVVMVVKIMVGFLDSGVNSSKIVKCVDCFVSGECD